MADRHDACVGQRGRPRDHMTRDAESPDGPVPLQLDAYGIKVQGSLKDVASPTSWRDVLQRLNRALMTLAAAPLELPADAINLARRLMQFGASRAPEKAVTRAHDVADTRESAKHDESAARVEATARPVASEEAVRNLEAFLEAKRRVGITAEIRFVGKTAVVTLCRAGCDPTSVVLLAETLLESLQNPPEPIEDELPATDGN